MPKRRFARATFLALALISGKVAPGGAVDADIPPMARKIGNFDRALLAPVDGITLRQIGQATYLLTLDPDANKAAVLAKLHLTPEQFDKADAVFTERMKTDRTFTIINLFAAYGLEASEGFYAPLGRDVAISVIDDVPLKEKEPMPEAKFREIQSYYGRKAAVAGTALDKQDEVLKPYGISFNDFQILGAWFTRRLALDNPDPPGTFDRGPPDEARDNPKQHPEWAGLWRFSWSMLRHGERGMDIVVETKEACLTPDAKLLMPHPKDAKCVTSGLSFYESGISLRAQCDHGAYGSNWGLELSEVIAKGKSYKGVIQFSLNNEKITELPKPETNVTAERIGDCR